MRQGGGQVGVPEGTIRHALGGGGLPAAEGRPALALSGPRARSERDARARGGVAIKRHAERALARVGQLVEAAPEFVEAEAVRYGGAFLGVPAPLAPRGPDAREQANSAPQKGVYRLRSHR